MSENWAEENLQTIRTLMERSAVYRRALAPIMLFAGTLGVAAAAIGLVFHLDSIESFCALWLGTAVIVITSAFFNTRRQAIRDKENVWSPPTRRVAQALLPPLMVGLFIAVVGIMENTEDNAGTDAFIPLIWAIFYGLALHSAGFFISRGVKWFGWIYIVLACAGLGLEETPVLANLNAHWFMGFFFGVLHLGYGAYLYLTEKGKNAA